MRTMSLVFFTAFALLSNTSIAVPASGDAVDVVKAASYKTDQLKSSMIATAERFKLAVNDEETARTNLDAVSKSAPNDKAAYKAALRRMLDADDKLQPFDDGLVRAGQMKEAGFSATAPIDITLCNGGACTPVEPEVLLFVILAEIVKEEGNKKIPFGPNNEIVKFLNKPLGGPGSDLVKARDWAMDRLGINGENNNLGNALKDPVKEFKRGDVGKTICNWFGC